jgi:hypothetical protein
MSFIPIPVMLRIGCDPVCVRSKPAKQKRTQSAIGRALIARCCVFKEWQIQESLNR